MGDYVEVIIIVEGQTEQKFVQGILAPYFALRNIFVTATLVGRPGHKGGDIRFERVFSDIEISLKQRQDVFVSTMLDYYGIKQWPGFCEAGQRANPLEIASLLQKETHDVINAKISERFRPSERFIPYFSIHEFEALLFSDYDILAKKLEVSAQSIEKEIGNKAPEEINNGVNTHPVKRIEGLTGKKYKRKTTLGISIAHEIGIEKMREKCPNFNRWLTQIESLKPLR